MTAVELEGAGVEFVNKPIKAFATRLRAKKGKDTASASVKRWRFPSDLEFARLLLGRDLIRVGHLDRCGLLHAQLDLSACAADVDIKLPFLTVRETLLYSPVKAAPQVKAPVMVMAAEKDIVNPPAQARLLFDALTCTKTWHIQSGARHYDLYSPPHFDEVASLQLAWLASNMAA